MQMFEHAHALLSLLHQQQCQHTIILTSKADQISVQQITQNNYKTHEYWP